MTFTNKILLQATFIGFLALGLFGPIYAIFVQRIGGDVLEAGIAYGVFSIVSGVFVFLVGRAKWFQRHLRGMVVLGYGLFALGNWGYLLVQNSWHLLAVQVVLGVAGGVLEPSWDALFSVDLTEEKGAHVWSTWAGIRDVATGAGAIAGGAIVAAFSFKALFVIMGFLCAVCAVDALRLLKEKEPAPVSI